MYIVFPRTCIMFNLLSALSAFVMEYVNNILKLVCVYDSLTNVNGVIFAPLDKFDTQYLNTSTKH